jgi:hypothetical protein
MRSSAFTCWDEQRLPWKSQAVHSSMLHSMVQPAYLTFRQQCRQHPAPCSSSSSSSCSSSISRVVGTVTQQLHGETMHAKLQQAAVAPVCAMHAYGESSSTCTSNNGSIPASTGHSTHSLPATLKGPVTSSTISSSSSSSGPAKASGGSPGPPRQGRDGDEFGPNFGGKLLLAVLLVVLLVVLPVVALRVLALEM